MILFLDDKSYYILYCCTHCDEKFGSEDALQLHSKTCKVAADITWIKQEPQEEEDCVPPPQEKTTSMEPATLATTLPPTPRVATPIGSHQSQASIPVSEIKTEPGQPLPSAVPAVYQQQAAPHAGVPQQGMCQFVMPQFLVPTQAMPQQVVGQPQGPIQLFPFPVLRQTSQPRLPQQTNPLPSASTPQYHDAAKHLTASEILRQRYQKMQPPQPPPSTESDVESVSKVQRRGRKKRTPVPIPTATRSIRPKTAPASATVHSFTVEPQSSNDPSLPKIERVYYTSKTDADSVGKATLADSAPETMLVSDSRTADKSQKKCVLVKKAKSVVQNQPLPVSKAVITVQSRKQPPPVSKGMTAVQSKKQTPPVSKSMTAVQSQDQPLPASKAVAAAQSLNQPPPVSRVVTTVAVSGSVPIVQPQQSVPTMQTLQQVPQTLQQAAQTLQQTPQAFIQTPQGLVQVPQTFLQNPQNLLQSSQTLFHSPQPVLQNTQTALQQSLLQQNLLQIQAQAAQQNFQNSLLLNGQTGSQLMPVLTPPSCSGATTVLSTQPVTPTLSVPVAASTAPTVVATPSSSQTPTSPTGSKPLEPSKTVVTSSCKPALSAPHPVTALSQLVGGIPAAPAASQRVQIAVPNPNGAGIILLTGNLKSGVPITGQTANQQNSPVALGNQPVVTPNPVGIPAGIANPQQGFIPQNPASNVLFLPPMMSQGHVLSGIQIQQPALVSPVTTQGTALQTVVQENLTPKETKTSAAESPSLSSSDSTDGKSKNREVNSVPAADTVDASPLQLLLNHKQSPFKHQHLAPKRIEAQQSGLKGQQPPAEMASSRGSSSRKERKKKAVSSPTAASSTKSSSSDPFGAVSHGLLSDKTVLDIAKLLLFEVQKMKEKGPVILDDGRIFVPVAYTGPYTLRNTKLPPKQLVRILPDWPWLKPKKRPKSDFGEKREYMKGVAERSLEESQKKEESGCSPAGRTVEKHGKREESDHSPVGKTVGNNSTGECDHDLAGNIAAEGRDKEENEPHLPQTITLPGDVVWIFLDKDGPKILWKLEGVKQRVMVLPLDYDLPAEAMKQMAEMLSRIKVDFPFGSFAHSCSQTCADKSDACLKKACTLDSEGHSWYDYSPFTQKLAGRKADLELVTKTAQILSKKNQPILPKGRPVNAPPPLQVRPPPNPSPEKALKRVNPLQSVAPKGPPPALISAAQCVPATPHTSVIKLKLEHQDPPEGSDKHSTSQSGVAFHSFEDTEQLFRGQGQGQHPETTVTAGGRQLKPADRRRSQSKKPQLTVMADASVIRRALEAFVRVERVPLTDAQQQYLKAHRVAGKRKRQSRTLEYTADPSCKKPEQTTEDAQQRKRGRKPKWLKELEQKRVSKQTSEDTPRSSDSLSQQVCEKRMLTVEGGNGEKKRKRGRPRLKREEDEDYEPSDDSFGAMAASQQERGNGSLRLTSGDEKEDNGTKEHEASKSIETKKGTTGREGERRGSKRKRSSCQIGWSQSDDDDDEVTDAASRGCRSRETCRAKRRRTKSGIKVEPEEEKLDVSGGSVEAGVRRSIRIFCKPKPDYCALESQDFIMDEDLDHNVHCSGDDKSQNIAGTAKVEGDPDASVQVSTTIKADSFDTAMETSTSVLGSRSLGRHAGFDVYVETADDTEDDEGRLVIDGSQNKEDAVGKEDAIGGHGESQEGTDSADQFFSKHKGDFEQMVMKDIKRSKDTRDGATGHILYLCTICGSFQSRSRDELISHLKQHYSGELTCQVCRFSAASRQELIEHEALEHTGKPLYHCHVCKTPFFSQTIFKNHLKRHSVAITCKVCSTEFPNEGGLKEHLEREHAQEYICHLCNQRFVSEDKVSCPVISVVRGFHRKNLFLINRSIEMSVMMSKDRSAN